VGTSPTGSFERTPAGDASTIISSESGGTFMGKEARVGLLLGATACLLAIMVDWIVEDL
jgi:hypothetical protein